MVALLALLQHYLRLARVALLLLLGACGCSRCCSSRWERRLAARVRVHGGAGRAARAPPLDGGTVAYVDGSVAANSAMGAGIFYGVGHPLNRSVRLRQWWSDSRRRDGSNSEEERLLEEGRGDPNLAELGAVYLALLFHPPDLPLTLCTDSLFTLQQLQWLTAQQVRPASYLVNVLQCCSAVLPLTILTASPRYRAGRPRRQRLATVRLGAPSLRRLSKCNR